MSSRSHKSSENPVNGTSHKRNKNQNALRFSEMHYGLLKVIVTLLLTVCRNYQHVFVICGRIKVGCVEDRIVQDVSVCLFRGSPLKYGPGVVIRNEGVPYIQRSSRCFIM